MAKNNNISFKRPGISKPKLTRATSAPVKATRGSIKRPIITRSSSVNKATTAAKSARTAIKRETE